MGPAEQRGFGIALLVIGALVLVGAAAWVLLPYRVYILSEPIPCPRGPVVTYAHPTSDEAQDGCYGEAHHRIVESVGLGVVSVALLGPGIILVTRNRD